MYLKLSNLNSFEKDAKELLSLPINSIYCDRGVVNLYKNEIKINIFSKTTLSFIKNDKVVNLSISSKTHNNCGSQEQYFKIDITSSNVQENRKKYFGSKAWINPITGVNMSVFPTIISSYLFQSQMTAIEIVGIEELKNKSANPLLGYLTLKLENNISILVMEYDGSMKGFFEMKILGSNLCSEYIDNLLNSTFDTYKCKLIKVGT